MVASQRVIDMENVSNYFPKLEEPWTQRYCRLELGLGWYGNYDGYDLAALTLLSHGPSVR